MLSKVNLIYGIFLTYSKLNLHYSDSAPQFVQNPEIKFCYMFFIDVVLVRIYIGSSGICLMD